MRRASAGEVVVEAVNVRNVAGRGAEVCSVKAEHIQICCGDIHVERVEIGVYHIEPRLELDADIRAAANIDGIVRKRVEADIVHAHFQELLRIERDVAARKVRVGVVDNETDDLRQVGDVSELEHLSGQCRKEGVLRFDTAKITVRIAGAVVVLAEAHDLLALIPVQKLVAGRERDMKILFGVVVVHIDRDIEIYAADAVDDLLEHISVHDSIAVDPEADKILDLRDKLKSILGGFKNE